MRIGSAVGGAKSLGSRRSYSKRLYAKPARLLEMFAIAYKQCSPVAGLIGKLRAQEAAMSNRQVVTVDVAGKRFTGTFWTFNSMFFGTLPIQP